MGRGRIAVVYCLRGQGKREGGREGGREEGREGEREEGRGGWGNRRQEILTTVGTGAWV